MRLPNSGRGFYRINGKGVRLFPNHQFLEVCHAATLAMRRGWSIIISFRELSFFCLD
ncbi:MAG TPA: hypothetical protein VFD22_01375 [Gemmatimonadaceae bacterium]|nr:hypothetical protein [Gemmatimonadaceae bacterium]